jgi:Protein of unknown function (DUF975).
MSQLRIRSKQGGLKALRGAWIKSILIFVILVLLSVGMDGFEEIYRSTFNIPYYDKNGFLNMDIRSFWIELIFAVVSLLIVIPILLGVLEWFWNLSEGKKTDIGDVFAWYGEGRLYIKSILFGLNVGVRQLLWGVLTCGLPIVMLIAANYYASGIRLSGSTLSAAEMQKVLFAGLLSLFGVMLLICGLLLFVYITSRYIPAYFLMVEDNTRKGSQAIRDSIRYSRGFRWEYTKFVFSYVGWGLLCIAIFPALFVVPYFLSSLSLFTKHIIYSQRPSLGDTVQFEKNA